MSSAERWARRALDVLESQGLADTATGGWASATLGAVLARAGDRDEGERLLRLGIDRMRAASEPLLVIQVLLALTAALGHRAPPTRDDGRSARRRTSSTPARIPASCGSVGGGQPEPGRQHRARSSTARRLTKRELEILRMLPTRLSQREIGRRLFVSYNTVHSHIRSIYRKLGVSSRVDAVERPREEGLLWESSRESPG